jgi:hypothetical protein
MERIKAEILSYSFNDRCLIINNLLEKYSLIIYPNTTKSEKNIVKFLSCEPNFKEECRYIYNNVEKFSK